MFHEEMPPIAPIPSLVPVPPPKKEELPTPAPAPDPVTPEPPAITQKNPAPTVTPVDSGTPAATPIDTSTSLVPPPAAVPAAEELIPARAPTPPAARVEPPKEESPQSPKISPGSPQTDLTPAPAAELTPAPAGPVELKPGNPVPGPAPAAPPKKPADTPLIKIVISHHNGVALVGIRRGDTDPIFTMIKGSILDATKAMPGLLVDCSKKWAQSPRNPVAVLPAEAPAASKSAPTRPVYTKPATPAITSAPKVGTMKPMM